MNREYPDKPVVAVGASIRRQDRVLIIQRANPPSQGVWTVPGGKVELGEHMEETVAREVLEECGIKVRVGEVVGTFDNIVYDEQGRIRYHYAIIDFAAEYISGELTPNEELLGAEWVTLNQLDAYGVPAKAQEILHKVLRT